LPEAGCSSVSVTSIAGQVDQHLAEAGRIAHESVGHLGCDAASQFQPPLGGAHGEQLGRAAHALRHIEVDDFELEPGCFDLGEIQNIVQQMQQSVGRLLNHLHPVTLLLVEIGREHQFRHPHDAVHRRADFMAHVGQELAFRSIGSFRGFLCCLELDLRFRQIPGSFLHPFLELIPRLDECPSPRFDLAQHLVEGVGQCAQLVGRELLRSRVVLAAAERLGDLHHLVDGSAELPGEPGGGDQRSAQGGEEDGQADQESLSRFGIDVRQ
jgi:hypothetical protein